MQNKKIYIIGLNIFIQNILCYSFCAIPVIVKEIRPFSLDTILLINTLSCVSDILSIDTEALLDATVVLL